MVLIKAEQVGVASLALGRSFILQVYVSLSGFIARLDCNRTLKLLIFN